MRLSDEERLAKNQRIKEAGKATRKRRSQMEAVTRELKLDASRFSKKQKDALKLAFREAKWLRNHILNIQDFNSGNAGKLKIIPVRLPTGETETRELKYLGSQVKQEVAKELQSNLRALKALKENGHEVGALKFCREKTTLSFIQPNVTYKLDKCRVRFQGLPGWFRHNGRHQLEGLELTSSILAKRSTGYFLLVTGYRKKEKEAEALLPPIGIDFGISKMVTTSDGREFDVWFEETGRLKHLQRKLRRQIKGSANYNKTRKEIGKIYQRLSNKKNDAGNKVAALLLKHEFVVFQDDNLRAWKRRFGRKIQHSSLGRVKTRLDNSPRGVKLDKWLPTTQYCRECGVKTKHELSKRVFQCKGCDATGHRDRHAAENMLWFAGFDISPEGLGIVPVEDEALATLRQSNSKLAPVKQEARQQSKTVAETRRSSVVA